ncbi:hypothetical protein EJ06DRAFT_583482 [Trichodelitschia bisporula]|uniref:Uncharacterized protein n=1 Tax=Trichodelitschia bisporula TaxID=703511 RepID=A0A6G1HSI6_9PEZI|nr:hypothetical protein EJ06DRAFT_583482 [Trichodelitschia bisporula]
MGLTYTNYLCGHIAMYAGHRVDPVYSGKGPVFTRVENIGNDCYHIKITAGDDQELIYNGSRPDISNVRHIDTNCPYSKDAKTEDDECGSQCSCECRHHHCVCDESSDDEASDGKPSDEKSSDDKPTDHSMDADWELLHANNGHETKKSEV